MRELLTHQDQAAALKPLAPNSYEQRDDRGRKEMLDSGQIRRGGLTTPPIGCDDCSIIYLNKIYILVIYLNTII